MRKKSVFKAIERVRKRAISSTCNIPAVISRILLSNQLTHLTFQLTMNLRSPTVLILLVLLTNGLFVMSQATRRFPPSRDYVGAVYAATNDIEKNSIIAYGRLANGTIERFGTFRTGGKGGGDTIDPLSSQFNLIPTPDNRFLIVANPGSSSISVFKVLRNFGLRLKSVRRVSGFGPSTVAYCNGIVYAGSVTSEDTLNTEGGVFSLEGSLTGFRLTRFGKLVRIRKSVRQLPNRPSTIEFTADGRSLVVSSVAAGSAQLNTTDVDEVYVYRVFKGGLLSAKPIDTAASTLPNNPEGRALPSAIGFRIVKAGRSNYVVVTEGRFQDASGVGPARAVSSVSTWKLTKNQALIPGQLDVLVGKSLESGQVTTCWVEFSRTNEYFWVTNSGSGTISSFSFKDGKIELVQEVAATAVLPVDLWLSSDGKFLYQLSINGEVDVFEVENDGFGPGLTNIQNIPGELQNFQGIVAM